MSTQENKNNFEWVWYVLGMVTGILAVLAVTTNFGYILLGAIVGGLIYKNLLQDNTEA